MNIRINLKLGIIAILSALSLSTLYSQSKPEALLIPEQFLRSYDPITVFYNQDVGPKNGGPADGPGEFLSLSPAWEGEYRWLDARTLQFLPAAAWPALTSFTVHTKSQDHTLETLMLVPSGINPPAGSKDLEPVEDLTLVFPSALSVQDLAQMVQFEVRELPGLSGSKSRTLSPQNYSLRELESYKGPNNSAFRFKFKEAIPYGSRLVLRLQLAKNLNLNDALSEYHFDTRADFRLLGVGSGSLRLPLNAQGARYTPDQALDCGSGRDPLWLEFSEQVQSDTLEQVKKMIRFEPAVRNLETRWSGNRLYLYFDADRDRQYKMSLQWEKLKSRTQRELSAFGDSSLWFYYRQNTPYLNWRQAQGMVEQYGPQVLAMEGRGIDKVDLRIYKIDPEDPSFFPFPDSPVRIQEDSRPPMPGEEPAAGNDLSKQIRLLGSPEVSRIFDLVLDQTSPRSRFGIDLKADLEKAYGKNKAGSYLVGYRLLGDSSERQYVRLNVTDLSLSTVEEENRIKFFVSSLNTALPVQGAEIRLEYASRNTQGERIYKTLISGTSDAQGCFTYTHTKDLDRNPERIVLKKGQDTLVIPLDNPPPVFANSHWSRGGTRWLDWLRNKVVTSSHDAKVLGWALSERPMYRPDETVHLLGWVRERQDGKIQKYTGKEELELYIRNGSKEWIKPVKLEDNGRFNLDFSDSQDLTGTFNVDLRQSYPRLVLDSFQFKKEAYRIPEFEINITGPDKVASDKAFSLTLLADYYAGGRVVGQKVHWERSSYPYSIRSLDWQDYIFSSDERFFSASPSSFDDSLSEDMILDDEGSASLEINPALESDGRARRYVVEATVEGADSQSVRTVRQVLALPPFNLGIKLSRLHENTKILEPEYVVLDHALEPLEGLELEARLIQRQWHSFITETDISTGEAKYVNDTVDKVIEEQSLKSGKTAQKLHFEVPEPGVYLVEISARDRLGRRYAVRTDTFVSGKAAQTWERKTAGLFELQAAQNSYAPGDTAKILIKSPWQEAQALMVLENPQGNQYQWVPVTQGTGIFEFKVQDNMIPNVPINALLMRGRVEGSGPKNGSLTDLGKPASLGASLNLNIAPLTNQAVLSLVHASKSSPGAQLDIDLTLSDPAGKALDGWVSLWLVDRAVLSLAPERDLNPLSHFITRAVSTLRMRDLRNLVLGFIPLEELPGGDGYDEASRLELMNKTTVRKNFQTVPYFNPAIKVTRGKAHIQVPLPDNLTDFAIRAIASSDYDRFGVGRSQVSIRLPVIVQSAFPRFVRPGDNFKAGATARVVEGTGGPGLAVAEVKGLVPAKNSDIKIDSVKGSSYTRKITLDDKEALRLDFPWEVPLSLKEDESPEVSISMYVQRDQDKARDAYQMQVPLKDEASLRSLEALSSLEQNSQLDFPEPTEAVRPGSLKHSLLVSRDLRIVRLLQSFAYLENFPYGCLEQRIAQLYPGIVLKSLTESLGVEVKPVSKGVLADFVRYLESCQDSEGLYGFWPGSEGYVFLTAYVLEFLQEVPSQDLPEIKGKAQAVKALRRALRSDYSRLLSSWTDYERVEALSALAGEGIWEEGYANQLLRSADRLPLYSQARLLELYCRKNLQKEKSVQALADSLASSIITKKEGRREIFAGLSQKTSYGGLVLNSELRSLSAVLEALALYNAGNPKLALLAEGIMDRSNNQGWGNTMDNTAALRVMKVLFALPNVSFGTVRFDLSVDGKTSRLDLGSAKFKSFPVPEGSRISLNVLSGPKSGFPIHFLLQTEYKPDGKSSSFKAQNKGFVIKRESLLISDKNTLQSRSDADADHPLALKAGAVVEDHVTLINPSDAEYLALRIPLAAGCEPLNPELATAPKEAQPLGSLSLSPSYVQYLDDVVVFYYNKLPKGSYDFYFRVRANFEGNFSQPPARAELMYRQSIQGSSDGQELQITK